jgi:RNA recognition motif-containing protein
LSLLSIIRFVTYQNKTSAATAIEAFNNYKLNNSRLTVRYSDNNNTLSSSSSSAASAVRSSVFMTPANSTNLNENESNENFKINDKSLNVSMINESIIREQQIVTAEDLNRARPMGRGVLLNGHSSTSLLLFPYNFIIFLF